MTVPTLPPIQTHAGWACDVPAALILEARTGGLGKVGTLYASLHACHAHQDTTAQHIWAAGYDPEPRRTSPAYHRWDPQPCGRVTAYSSSAAGDLAGDVA